MSELDDLASANVLTAAPEIEAEKSDDQKQEELKQATEQYQVAALSEHPGWQSIRKQMEKDIEDFRSLKFINMQTLTNQELGEAVRAEHLAANKLNEYLHKIDEAVRAVEDGRLRN